MNTIQEALENYRLYSELLTSYVNELQLRSDREKIQEFADLRHFRLDTVLEAGIFYIREAIEMLLPIYFDQVQYLGVISETNYKPIFNNRWIIPIKNQDGLVVNLVGYRPDANERYIYGTSKYYRRRETMYGIENLKLAYDLGYAIITEGITDAIRLRDMGYKNSFAMCGTHRSDYIMHQLNRCRHGVIKIPDRDAAGLRALKGWKCNRGVTLLVGAEYKDIDELCRVGEDNQSWFKGYMNICIDWIKSDYHNGQECLSESVTMM